MLYVSIFRRVGVLLLAIGVAQANDSLPHRRAGLWRLTVAVPHVAGPGPTLFQCVAVDTDEQLFAGATNALPTALCDHSVTPLATGGMDIGSACKTAFQVVVSRIHITGNLQSAYHAELSLHHESLRGSTSDAHSSIEAKWLGPCPASLKPGETQLNDGSRRTLGSLNEGEAELRAAISALDLSALKEMSPNQRREYLRQHAPATIPIGK